MDKFRLFYVTKELETLSTAEFKASFIKSYVDHCERHAMLDVGYEADPGSFIRVNAKRITKSKSLSSMLKAVAEDSQTAIWQAAHKFCDKQFKAAQELHEKIRDVANKIIDSEEEDHILESHKIIEAHELMSEHEQVFYNLSSPAPT